MQSFIGIHLLIRDGFTYKHKVFSQGTTVPLFTSQLRKKLREIVEVC